VASAKAMYLPTIIGSHMPPNTFARAPATAALTDSITPGIIIAASGADRTSEKTNSQRWCRW
jgi:hypothetical protein